MMILKLALFSLFIMTANAKSFEHWDTLNLTTFNTALAQGFIPYSQERVAAIIESLKSHNADILCLQEVWKKEDQESIAKSLQEFFPWSYTSPIEQLLAQNAPVCSIENLFSQGSFARCLMDKCSKKSKEEKTACIINDCKIPLEKLRDEKPECARALMAQVGNSFLKSLWTILSPFKKSGLYTYKGSNGLMLLSRYPLIEAKTISMAKFSSLTRRDVIEVQVEIKKRRHHIFCTHLGANLEGIAPYAGEYKSWEEENYKQSQLLVNLAQNIKHNSVYIMGDFNCSFANKNKKIQAQFLTSCQNFTKAGFVAPIMKVIPQCSFCSKNTLNEPLNIKDYLIDHIFVKNVKSKKVDVVFKDKVKIKVDKNEIETNLSDHYGLSLHIDTH